MQNHLAQRGKNKQGRANLRQVSYALVCAAHGQWPLYYEVYEGHRHDSRQLGEMLGRPRTLVVSWHQGLFEAQWATVQSELARALRKLAELQQSLQRRQHGEVKGGKTPTVESVHKQCREILHREQRRSSSR
ncbi:MAG: hypothetical protein M5U12_24040 [Verrucomicrobia bacterium]|nr:hypothetical protein [Verrucomicrobiota bacterium]